MCIKRSLGTTVGNPILALAACCILVATPADAVEQPPARIVDASNEAVAGDSAADDSTANVDGQATKADAASSERGEKVKRRRERRAKAARERTESKPGEAASEPIRVHVRGSFEIGFGNHPFIRAQGSTTLHLDAATAGALGEIIGRQLETDDSDGENLGSMLQMLSEILESTREILRSLSDPKTQQALRQTQQLLELLPKSSPETAPF